MKKIGFIIIALGLLIMIITGAMFVTSEKVVDIGKMKISMDKKHSFNWSPVAA